MKHPQQSKQDDFYKAPEKASMSFTILLSKIIAPSIYYLR
jgi:hypothetical protein